MAKLRNSWPALPSFLPFFLQSHNSSTILRRCVVHCSQSTTTTFPPPTRGGGSPSNPPPAAIHNPAFSIPHPTPMGDLQIESSRAICSRITRDETEELERLEHAPPFLRDTKSQKQLSKQLSMREMPRYRAWERRRRRILDQTRKQKNNKTTDEDKLTDDDLKELKGCIELGFGFKEESGQQLCPTIPALDLYFAVNRQFSNGSSPLNSPSSSRSVGGSSSGSPKSDSEPNWKILSPGDDPEQVKIRLRHWAQAVACSVMQSPLRAGEMDCAEKER